MRPAPFFALLCLSAVLSLIATACQPRPAPAPEPGRFLQRELVQDGRVFRQAFQQGRVFHEFTDAPDQAEAVRRLQGRAVFQQHVRVLLLLPRYGRVNQHGFAHGQAFHGGQAAGLK